RECHGRSPRFAWCRPRARPPRAAAAKSARDARRPFTNAVFWRVGIRSTTGAMSKSINIGPAWRDMANKNDWQRVPLKLIVNRNDAIQETAGPGRRNSEGFSLARNVQHVVIAQHVSVTSANGNPTETDR